LILAGIPLNSKVAQLFFQARLISKNCLALCGGVGGVAPSGGGFIYILLSSRNNISALTRPYKLLYSVSHPL
jgi:hypothetical protein